MKKPTQEQIEQEVIKRKIKKTQVHIAIKKLFDIHYHIKTRKDALATFKKSVINSLIFEEANLNRSIAHHQLIKECLQEAGMKVILCHTGRWLVVNLTIKSEENRQKIAPLNILRKAEWPGNLPNWRAKSSSKHNLVLLVADKHSSDTEPEETPTDAAETMETDNG